MKNYKITVNGVAYQVTVEEAGAAASASAPVPSASAASAAPVFTPSEAPKKGSVSVEAPMPGNILEVKTQVGAAVDTGDTLLILEAMKMENQIVAPSSGTVASIEVNKGDSVDAGQVLLTLD